MAKLAIDTIYVFIGSFLAVVFSYLFRIVLVKYLSIEEYGLFYSMWTFITFFLFFIYLGLDQSGIYYVVKYRLKKDYDGIKTVLASMLFWQMISSTVLVILIFIFSGYLEASFFSYTGSGYIIKVFSFFIFFNLVMGVFGVILSGYKMMRYIAFVETGLSFFSLALAFVFLKLGLGTISPFIAYIMAQLLVMLIFFFPALRQFNFFKFKIVAFMGVTKQLFSYGFPMLLSALGYRLIMQIDTLMLTKMTDLKQVGLYQSALPTANILAIFSVSISTVIFPFFVEMYHEKKFVEIRQTFELIYKYLALLVIPIVVAMVVFSDMIIGMLFGYDYLGSHLTLKILSIGMIFVVFSTINLRAIAAFGMPHMVTKLVLSSAALTFILNLILIPIYGINGAALTTLFSYFMMFGLSFLFIRKIFIKKQVKLQLLSNLWLVILGMLLYVLMITLRSFFTTIFMSLCIVMISTLAYFISCFALKIISRSDLEYFRNIFKEFVKIKSA